MVAVKKDKINGDALGTGRRKSRWHECGFAPATARVIINRRPLEEYFSVDHDRRQVTETLELAGHRGNIDVIITVQGGGTTGQAGACKMGIARALVSYDIESFPALRDAGALTRDSRMKERKKYGLHGARKGTQFSKR